MEATEPAGDFVVAGGNERGLGDLTRAETRLVDELDEDGITLPTDPVLATRLVQELDHVRRPPIHEGKPAIYGSFVPLAGELGSTTDLVELIDLDGPLDDARRFAEGRSTFLVRGPGDIVRLACFRRTVQYEAELVEVQQRTGAAIVQRTVLGLVRAFTDEGIVVWNGRSWTPRPTARSLLPHVERVVDEGRPYVLAGLLDLCLHWLSPSRVGATLLYDFDPRHDDAPSLDLDAAIGAPQLSVAIRHHYPALFAALRQTDLATLVHPNGTIDQLGVGLRSSIESEQAVAQDRGMRHRSAARYTWDHHHTVAFVVSEDGPVTIFRHGRPLHIYQGPASDETETT